MQFVNYPGLQLVRPGNLLQAFGLLVTGFILGIMVAGLNRGAVTPAPSEYAHSTDYPGQENLQVIGVTDAWDILADKTHGKRIALGQNGVIRVVVQDDTSALYVMTYKQGEPLWQGRLMDVGNDGTVEVADLTAGHCEAFP